MAAVRPTASRVRTAIAVRDPAVHWDGQKALFSMVIGAPAAQYDYSGVYYWQIYEITGLGPDDTPVITQGAATSRPTTTTSARSTAPTTASSSPPTARATAQRHLYPQLDEYETAPTVTGLWSLDPASGDLRLLNHAPSGDFTPLIDSFGRVVFTQWDHLQRDQQADADADGAAGGRAGTLRHLRLRRTRAPAPPCWPRAARSFPSRAPSRSDLLAGTNLAGHSFNHFFPWTILTDGTEGEVLNHLGRHELHGYIPAAISDDANVYDYYGQEARFNPNPIDNMLQIAEDPNQPGVYYGVDAPEFGTHAAGQVISMTAPPSLDAGHVQVTYVTAPRHGEHGRCAGEQRPLSRPAGLERRRLGRRPQRRAGRGTGQRWPARLDLCLPPHAAGARRRRLLCRRCAADRRHHGHHSLLEPGRTGRV